MRDGAMLQAIPAAEVGTDGRALEVRYRAAPGRPGLVVVTVLAHAVEGGLVDSIAKCESSAFAGVCPSEMPLARTYRHLDLDQRRTLFRLVETRTESGAGKMS